MDAEIAGRASESVHRGRGEVELSVVVPVLNGAGFIAETLHGLAVYLHEHVPGSEIVVVNDGSNDGTARLIEELGPALAVPVVLVDHEKQRGKGAAVRTGMLAARGRYRVFTDADLAYAPSDIGVLLDRLRAGAEVVVASRVHPESRYVLRPSFFRYLYTRHLSGRLFNWLVRIFLLPGVTDSQAGLKGFSAKAAVALFAGWMPDGFGFDLAVLAKARRQGFEVAEVPVTFRYDQEPTTMRFLADSADMLRDLVLVRLRIGHGGAIPSGGWSPATASPVAEAAWSPPWRLLVVLACLLGVVEAARGLHAPLLVPLGVWLGALGLWLGFSGTSDRERGVPPGRWVSGWQEAAVVAGITLLAAFLRLVALDEIPALIHHDTASCALVGRRMLEGVSTDPFALAEGWYFFPRLGLLPYTLSLELLGTSVVALRLTSAIPGILLVPALYFLVRGWFGRPAAAVAALLLAGNHVAVHFSRDGIWNIHSLLLGVAGFAALFGGWRRRSGYWLAAAGIAFGLSLYTYTAGRLFFGLGVLAATALSWRQPRPRSWRLPTHFLVALVLTLTPLVASFVRLPAALKMDRVATVNPFSEARSDHVASQVGSTNPLRILGYQVRRTLAGFVTIGDSSSHYTIDRPMISPVILVLALAGIAFGLARFPDPRYLFLLVWLAAGLLFGSVLAINPPSFPRLLAVLPVPIVLASAMAGLIWEKARRLGGVVRASAAAILAAATALALVLNARTYVKFCRSSETAVSEWVVIRALDDVRAARTVYFFTGAFMLADSPAFELFREGRRHVFGLTEADLPERLLEPTAFVLAPAYRWVGTALTERFPELDRELVARRGVRLLTVYRSWATNPQDGRRR